MQEALKILLIESRGNFTQLITGLLSTYEGMFSLTHCMTLEDGLSELNKDARPFDVVLTNLVLVDTAGHDVIQRLTTQQNPVPIIVLVEDDSITLAKEMLGYGAQDYLNLKEISADMLRRSIIYSVERETLVKQIRDLTLRDELTQLYNRRGFSTFADQQLRIIQRTGQACTLLFLDLDNLKQINDTHGHCEGDRAIKDTANVLRKALRTSDVVCRLGGDEFVLLAPDTNKQGAQNLILRIQAAISNHNKKSDAPYKLSASLGIVIYKGEEDVTLQDLQAQACEKMYEQKKSKKKSRNTL